MWKKISLLIMSFVVVVTPGWAGTANGLLLLNNLPDNTWIKLNNGGATNVARFSTHGSIVVDTERNRVFLYGSDTHGESDNNSIWYFDLQTLTWNAVYPDDDPATYTKITGAPLPDGAFWAATTTGHPVASHIFDGMRYIPGRNAILVLQYPGHNDTVENVLGSVGEPALWLFDTQTLQWQLVQKLMPAIGIFGKLATTADGSLTVLSLLDDTYFFDWNTLTFTPYTGVSGNAPEVHHSGIEYDTYLQKFIVVGGSDEFAIKAFDPLTKTWELLQASGGPSLNGANIGYDTLNKVLIAHAVDNPDSSFSNSDGEADTYVRSSETGVWTKMLSSLAGDVVPPHFGFGFRGEYDMKHNVFYFVTQGETEPTQTDIWAYRYKGAGSNPDVTPAGVPTNVTAQTVSSSQINLSWSASSDPQSGIKSYGIYRNNTLVANTGATSYSDIGLSAGTTYSYQITAINGEGLESARSAAVSATTGPASPVPDTTPASVPANVTAQPVSSSQIILNWSASSDPQSGVTGYRLYRDNILLTTITSTVFNDIGLAPATTYDYQVSAINGEGLESARSAVVSATTTTAAPLPDKLFEDGFEDN